MWMDRLGQSLRRLSGWSPRSTSWKVSGTTFSQAEPELDWVDLALLGEWTELNAQACPQCGRPLPLHSDQEPQDFHIGYRTCPATQALDVAQLRKSKEPEEVRLREDLGLSPDRARTWFTFTDAEGTPSY